MQRLVLQTEPTLAYSASRPSGRGRSLAATRDVHRNAWAARTQTAVGSEFLPRLRTAELRGAVIRAGVPRNLNVIRRERPGQQPPEVLISTLPTRSAAGAVCPESSAREHLKQRSGVLATSVATHWRLSSFSSPQSSFSRPWKAKHPFDKRRASASIGRTPSVGETFQEPARDFHRRFSPQKLPARNYSHNASAIRQNLLLGMGLDRKQFYRP